MTFDVWTDLENLFPLRITFICTRVGTLIVATIYLQMIQNRYMIRSFTVLQCSHQHCIQPVASNVEVVGYLSSACCVDSSNGAVYRLKNLWNSSQAKATKWFLHLKVSYDFHIAGNGLYTMLVTTLKDSKTSKHVSILYQL